MLNHAQQEAVGVSGHAIITACPGSGKTTVLKYRAAHLLRAWPGSVLCGVTFTSDAAGELDQRIKAEVKDVRAASSRVICGTFHSLCKRQLTRAGYKFKLVTDVQQMDLMKRAYFDKATEADCSLEDAIRLIEYIKSQASPLLPSPRVKPSVLVYERYQELLQQMGAMDFSDLLVECVKGMMNGSVDPVTTEFGQVTHMLVDEFQDTDEVQLAWVGEHVRQGIEVTVVGDDDQAIYGWRRAMGYEAMNRFKRETNATHIALNLTYRCAREIITPAQRLIVHNVERVEKTLNTANRDAGEVRLHRFNSADEEIDGMLRAIRLSGMPGAWGLLARTNAQLDRVEQALVAESIDYIRSGGTSIWDLKAPSLFMGVCQSLGMGDMIGVDELLRRSGVSEAKLAEVHRLCRSKSIGGLDRFLSGALATNPAKDDALGVARKRLAEWRASIQKGEAKLAMEGIAHYLQRNVKLYEKAPPQKVIERDHRMLKQCVETLSRLSGNMQARLMTLRNFEKRKNEARDMDDVVRLMTLHSSKGLEYDRVWMMGCEQGVLPSRESPVDEERRLFFVGMTRAKRYLNVSYVRSQRTPPSMFIDEAGIF